MKEFILILPNEKSRTYKWVTIFILILNLGAYGFFLIGTTEEMIRNAGFLGIIFCTLSLLGYWFSSLATFLHPRKPEVYMILLSFIWLWMGMYLVAACIMCYSTHITQNGGDT